MTQWFIVRGSRQHGPVDDAKLRKLAASGKLLPDDIVRREDMSSGRKAKDIEGLLPLSIDDLPSGAPSTASPAMSAHSDQSTPATKSPASDVGNELMAGASVLGASAKITAQLAAKQAELASLQNLTLPSAYTELGQQVFQTITPPAEWQSRYDDIKQLKTEIERLVQAARTQPTPQTLAQKAQSIASSAGSAATQQVNQHKLRQLLSSLGRVTYETSELGPTDQRKTIAGLLERASLLDEDIARLKSDLATQKAAAGQVAAGFYRLGKSLLFHPWLVRAMAVVFAPVGVPMIWLHPTWKKRQKVVWTAISLLCLSLFCIWSVGEKARVTEEVKQANALWDKSEKGTALAKYRAVLRTSVGFVAAAERPAVFQRVIEADCEAGDTIAAKKLIAKARGLKVDLSLNSPAARRALTESGAEEEQKKHTGEVRKATDADRGLAIVQSILGTLNATALNNYQMMKRNYEKDGEKWEGTTSHNSILLLLLPTSKWKTFAKQYGLSREQYYYATNFAFIGTVQGYGFGASRQDHDRQLRQQTGEGLSDY